jgi:hypothetical protein
MPLICGEEEVGYFSREDWTGRIRLMRLAKLDSWRRGNCASSEGMCR